MAALFRLLLILLVALPVVAQQNKTKNLIVVTLDGFRWQELFGGADSRILDLEQYANNPDVADQFGTGSFRERRMAMMPFIWREIAMKGQLYGNRKFGNKVNCVNNHLLSYPGYSEMFVGAPERGVSSNDRKTNPNPTVFEYLNGHPAFRKKIAAFTTWDVFPYILREQKADLYVNAGNEPVTGQLTTIEHDVNKELNDGVKRNDDHTFALAFEHLRTDRPAILYIGFDGTDHNAHGGRYDEYLQSAHAIDSMLNVLWRWVQATPGYKDETTLFITTDHGRGNGKHTWKDHRLLSPGSRHVWFAVMGPDTPAFGEVRFRGRYYQKQVAKTLAAFLGYDYSPSQRTGEVVHTMIAVPGGPPERLELASERKIQNK